MKKKLFCALFTVLFGANAIAQSSAELKKRLGIIDAEIAEITKSLREKTREKLLNQLSLVWGTKTFVYDKFESTDGTIRDVNRLLLQKKLVAPGQIVINTSSTPLHEKGKTNTIRVSEVN